MSGVAREKIMSELGEVLLQLADLNKRASRKEATPSDFEKTCILAKRIKELKARLEFLTVINADKD